eukprot:3140470-Alexandrium_andersonii.AAC.1
MSASLVGSEMCIRDSGNEEGSVEHRPPSVSNKSARQGRGLDLRSSLLRDCLLYTSDAADDM